MTELVDLILALSQEIKYINAHMQQFKKTRLESFKEAWIDGQDIMQLLHISKRTLQSLRDEGTLPYSRLNGKFYYKVADVEQLLESNYVRAKSKNHGTK